jgi:hypothetical protein
MDTFISYLKSYLKSVVYSGYIQKVLRKEENLFTQDTPQIHP